LGLGLHKFIWEFLKRRNNGTIQSKRTDGQFIIRLIKLCKIILLTFLAIQTLFLDILPISNQPIHLRIFGFTVFLIGFATAVIGRLHLGNNWVDIEDGQFLPEQSLVSTGIYHYIRHPIYTGDLLLIIGLELALNSWLVLGVCVLLLIVIKKALEEETFLSKNLPGYTVYRQRTKMFIPFVL
jgi:protein-S-isoprenylcysteine O-methyltransferase Ste14